MLPNISNITTTLSQAREVPAATSSGELVFFAGGHKGTGPSDRVDIYNVTSGSWTTATLSIPRFRLAAASSQNLVFFAGGRKDPNWPPKTVYDRMDIYNTLSGSWSTATLSQPRCHLAATSVGNLVLFGGGYNSNGGYSNVVDVFDVTNNRWTTATLSQARAFLAATSVDNRYALFAGGHTGSNPSNVVDIFDSLSGMWNTTTLSQARRDLAATSLGNLAFFGGGNCSGNQLSNVVDIFNSTSQTWSTATLSQARYELAASSIGEIVAFGGGWDGSTSSSVVDMLNVTSNTWFTVNLSRPRSKLASASSTNKIFFGGGSISKGTYSGIVDIFEIYLPQVIHHLDPKFPQESNYSVINTVSSATSEISLSEIQLMEELGRGRFGVVKRAIYKGKQVAVKFIEGIEDDSDLYIMFRKELEILLTLDHPSIVKCWGGCTVSPHCFIVSEYCNGGSLYDLLHERKEKLSTQQQLDFALKIVEGMEYLHTRKPMIVHHDLKSQNILLQDGVPKIIDFGLSQIKGTLSLIQTPKTGTFHWMAPEMMESGGNITEKIDVWSYGMVLYEMSTNQIPYHYCEKDSQVIQEVYDKRKTPQFPTDRQIHPTLRDLMKQCWNWDPKLRPSFSQIIQTLKNVRQTPPTNPYSTIGPTQILKYHLPRYWDQKQKNALIDVALNSEEGQKVIKAWTQGGMPASCVVKIKRVQNEKEWQDYAIFKQNMGDNHNEKWLFHGTKAESVDKIIKEGFDFRLYGTAVGAKYGKGSYFAVKSSYSKNYSPPDSNNIRRMLLVRVCVGRVAPEPGRPELTRPPLDPQGRLYDSVTDNPKDPQMYVIFDNNQCYPAYVIEFKCE